MSGGRLKPGDRLDRYEVVRLIAAGGMGEVYEARHVHTGRGLAIKCLQVRHDGRGDLQQRMQLEAVALGRLDHPNLVTVYDAGVTGGVMYFVMDLLRGKTVRELLVESRALGPARAARYAAAIADGLAAAHALGVVHRDLKPENVLVTARDEVKVLDLGTAKFYGWGVKVTEHLRTVGTPQYMSPEHVKGDALDARSDVYALGVMAFEMATGQHPYARDGAMPTGLEVAPLHLFADAPRLDALAPDAPAGLADAVAKALAKSPDDRFPTMAAFAAALRGAPIVASSSAAVAATTETPAPFSRSLALSSPAHAAPVAPVGVSKRAAWIAIAIGLVVGGAVATGATLVALRARAAKRTVDVPYAALASSAPAAQPAREAAAPTPTPSPAPTPGASASAPAAASAASARALVPAAGRPGNRPAAMPKSGL